MRYVGFASDKRAERNWLSDEIFAVVQQEFIHLLGCVQTAQSMIAAIPNRKLPNPVAGGIKCGLAEENLTAICGCKYSRDAVQVRAEVISAFRIGVAVVNGDPYR